MIGIAIVVAVAAFAAGIAAWVHLGYPQKRLPDARHLSRKQQAVLSACADSFFPAGGPIPVSGTDAGLLAYMDNYLGRMPQMQRTLVALLLLLIEHGPWVFGPRRVRFSRLPEASRLLALDEMRTSDVYFRRVAFLSMRTMLTMGYLANADVARAMGMTFDTAPFDGAHAVAA